MRTTTAALAVITLWNAPTRAGALTVSSLSDSGAGTLRDVIGDANSNGENDTIGFGVTGTITLQTPLPAFTNDTGCTSGVCVSLDGTGVVLDGSAIPRPTTDAYGLRIAAPRIEVYNFTIVGFEDGGVVVDAGSVGTVISGCVLGSIAGVSSATRALGNYGILVRAGASQATITGNVIAGYTAGSAGYGIGIYAAFANQLTIVDNLIGLTPDGSQAVGGTGFQMDFGILLGSSHGAMLGSGAQGNTIGGQAISGIQVADSNNTSIGGNRVGTDITGTFAIPNGFDDARGGGVVITGSSDGTTIGSFGSGNILSGNHNCQIRLSGASNGSTVAGNVIGASWANPTAPLDGGAALSGNHNGVCIEEFSTGNVIGSSGALGSNLIAYHQSLGGACPPDCGAGILVRDPNAVGQTVANNVIGWVVDTGVVTTASAPNRYGFLALGEANQVVLGGLIGPNRIANATHAGIAIVDGTTERITLETNYLENNGTDRPEGVEICLGQDLADCVSHGSAGGGSRANGGVAPPTFAQDAFFGTVASGAVSVTLMPPGAGQVRVYETPDPPSTSGAGGSAREVAVVSAVSASPVVVQVSLPAYSPTCITAVFTDSAGNSSELAPNVRALVTDAPDADGATGCRDGTGFPSDGAPVGDGGPADGGGDAAGEGDAAPGDGRRGDESVAGGDTRSGDDATPGDAWAAGDARGGGDAAQRGDTRGMSSMTPRCSSGFARRNGRCVRELGGCSTNRTLPRAWLSLLVVGALVRRRKRAR